MNHPNLFKCAALYALNTGLLALLFAVVSCGSDDRATSPESSGSDDETPNSPSINDGMSSGNGSSGSGNGSSGSGNGSLGSGNGSSGSGNGSPMPAPTGPADNCAQGKATPSSLVDAIDLITVDTTFAGAGRYNGGGARIAETPEGDLFVAWAANPEAEVHITRVVGDTTTDDFVVSGYAQAYSVVAGNDSIHLLASSKDSHLDYIKLDLNGEVINSHRLVEVGERSAAGTTWADDILMDDGYQRMVATADGFAAYVPISRVFGGGEVHQGDTLRVLAPDGSQADEVWDWGCSHSDSQRVAFNGTAVGALCVTDCNPYGIRFRKSETLASFPDRGPCVYSGILAFGLSSLLPTDDGFVVLYSRLVEDNWRDGWREPTALHFVAMDHSGNILSDDVVAESGRPWQYSPSPQLAPYPGGYLAGWSEGSAGSQPTSRLIRLDAAGQPLNDGETTDISLQRGEFTALQNGDVVWATKQNGRELTIARVPACR